MASSSTLLHPESEAWSDDSGVDVKSRAAASAAGIECGRRNKRKSSEPKRRRDGLHMKRYRWTDTDEEEAFERPSSGDSGCQLEEEEEEEEEEERVKEEEEEEEEAFRQSVIRKNECPAPGASSSSTDSKDCDSEEGRRASSGRPRNYKGMSRQRRIEANARERTRVHTISAAFESLRRAVPAYAHNQKLSKLAILRIASAYIVALACLNGGEGPAASMAECVEQCTRTLQAEGRSRRRTFKD